MLAEPGNRPVQLRGDERHTPEEGGPVDSATLNRIGRLLYDLEDRGSQPKECLPGRTCGSRLIPDPTEVEPSSLEAGNRPLESRRDGDDMIDRGDAVGMRRALVRRLAV